MGVALLLGLHWLMGQNRVHHHHTTTPPPPRAAEKLGKHLLQFVLSCLQLRSVADEAL